MFNSYGFVKVAYVADYGNSYYVAELTKVTHRKVRKPDAWVRAMHQKYPGLRAVVRHSIQS